MEVSSSTRRRSAGGLVTERTRSPKICTISPRLNAQSTCANASVTTPSSQGLHTACALTQSMKTKLKTAAKA